MPVSLQNWDGIVYSPFGGVSVRLNLIILVHFFSILEIILFYDWWNSDTIISV
jgi:hypothetical protein